MAAMVGGGPRGSMPSSIGFTRLTAASLVIVAADARRHERSSEFMNCQHEATTPLQLPAAGGERAASPTALAPLRDPLRDREPSRRIVPRHLPHAIARCPAARVKLGESISATQDSRQRLLERTTRRGC